MSKKDYYDKIISETVHELLGKKLMLEYAMDSQRMLDKYSEVLHAIVDNLVCICLYPNNPTIPHWKSRIVGLSKKFIDTNIKPKSKNNFADRLKIFNDAMEEVLDEDYSALLNHFKSVSVYYGMKNDPHERLKPYKPYEEAYAENRQHIIDCLSNILSYTAAQDIGKLTTFVRDKI